MKTWLMAGLLITSTGFSKTMKNPSPSKDAFDVCLEKAGLNSLEPKFTVAEIKQKRENCYLEVYGPQLRVPPKNRNGN